MIYNHVVTRGRLTHTVYRILTIPILLVICQSCAVVDSSSDLVTQAEIAMEEGRYDDALESYRAHRDNRLEASDRPEWENPHFYTLLMGDVELRRGDPEAALRLYTKADQERISPSLIDDRYRAVAAWHLQNEQFDKALEVLKTHRGRDPLLFDAMLDKVAKRMTLKDVHQLGRRISRSSDSK